MCILCDLTKTDGTKQSAINYAEDIIDTCNKISGGYKSVLSGYIKPHTEEMDRLVQNEKHLVRLVIEDIL